MIVYDLFFVIFKMSQVELLIANDEEHAVFTYLFELQESGKTNMFGAAAYIINQPQFKTISIDLAINLVKKWMDNYEALRVALNIK